MNNSPVSLSAAHQMAYGARANNGGTWTVAGYPYTPETGYFVSVRLAPREIESRDPMQDIIGAELATDLAVGWNKAQPYSAPVAYVGAWLRDDGAMVWDVSIHVATLDEALKIGHENQQMAVWDCYNGRAITCA